MSQMNQEKKPSKRMRFSAFIHSRTLLSAVTLLLGFAVVFGVFTVVATPKRHALKAGDKVQLVGFGTFAVKARAERTARNPRTGETIKVAAAKVPTFAAGKALKDAVQ